MASKDAAMEMAEAARETEWRFPSFTAEMFRGNFRWDLLHPYPEQDPEDKKIGDELIEKIRAILEEYHDPIKLDETGEYPKIVLEKLAEIGVFGMKVSKEYGGLGFSQWNYGRVLSFIGSYCQTTVVYVSAHQSIGVPQPLKLFGTPEQKKKYLPRVAKGELSAFALTEPDVGSDPARMSTTATPSEDGTYYLINGEKLWCTNGPDSKIMVVMAQTPPIVKNGREIKQISCFIVETDSPGVDIVHRCSFMGLKGLSNGLMTFTNVKVPAENLIGKPGQGLKIALTTLNAGRLGIPAAAGGVCKGMLNEIERWINERIQWGVPIGKHQAIAKKVANMAANTYAMESLVYMACSFADRQNADIRLEAAAAKYFCTETTHSLLDDMIQVRGGRGFESDTSLYHRGERPVPVHRMFRDMRVGRIFEGSSEVMHLIMAREAMDTHLKYIMPLVMPKKGENVNKAALIANMLKFYAVWYPKLWLPAGADFNVKHLNASNRDHLAYCAKTAKRLARRLFHTMARFGPKLEFEQVILGCFVEIGVHLFVMGCTLARTEHLLAQNSGDSSAQELCDLFCKNSREKIANWFVQVKHNHNKDFGKVTSAVMEGKFRWMVQDVFGDLPKAYRDYAEQGHQAKGTEDRQPAARV